MMAKRSILCANLGNFLLAFNYKTIFEFVVLFYEDRGFDFEQASTLVTIMATTNFLVRLCSGFVVKAIGVFYL